MIQTASALLLSTLLLATTDVQAADFSDKTWPCIQRKVPRLSIGQMWTGEILDGTVQADDGTRTLARAVAVRRTSLEDAAALIEDYADGLGEDKERQLAILFHAIFEQIDRERTDVISGIGRYAAKQTGLSERIDASQQEIATLEAKEDKSNDDYDKLEEMQDIVTWDARIYTERQQSLRFVCETPVILEQRAFALARAVMEAAE